MAGVRLGPTPVRGMRRGSTIIRKALLGTRVVFNSTAVYDGFDREDEELPEGGQWVSHGPSTDYVASVVGGQARLGIPDGLIGLFERTSRVRFTGATASSEDGYLEFRVSTVGAADWTFIITNPYTTEVFAKVSNGGFSSGVGVQLAAGSLGLVVRRSNIDTVVKEFGSFAANDIIRLTFTGNTYTLFCRGENRGSWIDSGGQVVTGSSNRSLGLRFDGAKELLGPRRFSPAIDYVEYG